MFTIYSANPPLIIKLVFWPEKKEASYLHWLRIRPPKSLRPFWHALLTGGKPTVKVHLLVESRGTPGALGYQAGRDTRLIVIPGCGYGVGQAVVPPHSTPLGAFPPIFHQSWSLSCLSPTPLGLKQLETRSHSPWQFSLRDGGTALSSAIDHKIKKP